MPLGLTVSLHDNLSRGFSKGHRNQGCRTSELYLLIICKSGLAASGKPHVLGTRLSERRLRLRSCPRVPSHFPPQAFVKLRTLGRIPVNLSAQGIAVHLFTKAFKFVSEDVQPLLTPKRTERQPLVYCHFANAGC